jgi:hypothetical protein
VTPNGPSYRALPRLYKAVGLWWVQGKALVAESILSGLYPYEPTKGHRPLETVNPAILLTRHTSRNWLNCLALCQCKKSLYPQTNEHAVLTSATVCP